MHVFVPLPFLKSSQRIRGNTSIRYNFTLLNNPFSVNQLKDYVQGIIERFKNDERILAWDLFNEPDNVNFESYSDDHDNNKLSLALNLLKQTFRWARELSPVQTLTSAPWQDTWMDPGTLSEIDHFMFLASDIITFHCYDNKEKMESKIKRLKNTIVRSFVPSTSPGPLIILLMKSCRY